MESSSSNIAYRHDFAQDDEAEESPSKLHATSSASTTTTATANTAEMPTPPLAPAIFSEDQIGGVTRAAPSTPSAVNNESPCIANTDDARDEEEDSVDGANRSLLGEDPYVYSDDSASLSDAYFSPQAEEEFPSRPFGYRNDDEVVETAHAALLQYPLANYYGAVPASSALQEQGSISPLWVACSIREDSEMPHQHPSYQVAATTSLRVSNTDHPRVYAGSGRNERRRRQNRHNGKRQQSSAHRERAVCAVRGRVQDTTRARDVIWAVLFVLQLLAVIFCAIRFGSTRLAADTHEGHVFRTHYIPWYKRAYEETMLEYNSTTQAILHNDDVLERAALPMTPAADESSSWWTPMAASSFTVAYKNTIALTSITGLYACMISFLSFGFMLVLARALIKIILIFSVLLALAWGLIGLTFDPYGVISVLGFAAVLLTLAYTIYNWSSVPFASTNLNTALCALRCTADITILGFVCVLVAFAWCVVWGMAFIGIVNSLNGAECDQKEYRRPNLAFRHIPLYLLLLFSFHWTNTVIKNLARVTVASAVGIWWFFPRGVGRLCTPIVLRPLLRSLTTSFGSICLGSLVLQPAQALVAISSSCCCMLGNPDTSCTRLQRDSMCAKSGNLIVSLGDEGVDSAVESVGLCRRLSTLNGRFKICLRPCNRWSYTYIGMCK